MEQVSGRSWDKNPRRKGLKAGVVKHETSRWPARMQRPMGRPRQWQKGVGASLGDPRAGELIQSRDFARSREPKPWFFAPLLHSGSGVQVCRRASTVG